MQRSTFSLFFILCFALFFSSCTKETREKEAVEQATLSAPGKANQALKFNTFYGPQEQVGEGHARTFVTISHTGVPQEVGVIFTDKAFSGLPATNTIYSLPFHHKAGEATLFTHVALGLSVHGHGLPPSGSIGPHFDFRIFMMTEEQRLAIPAPPAPGFNVAPPPGYLPANYALNAPVAQIGRHWGENIFTAGMQVPHTMILGTWNGELTFINPIVTLETLRSGTSVSVAYPQPQFFARRGYYATRYNIYSDKQGRYYVSLSDFVWRAGTPL
jgi:hypothetical protein